MDRGRVTEADGPRGGWRRQLVARTLIVLFVIAAFGAALLLVYRLSHLIILIFIAVLIAAVLHVPVVWLERHGFPRLLAVAVPYVVVGGLLILLGFLLGPPLVRQVEEFAEDAPGLMEEAQAWVVGFLESVGIEDAGEVIDTVIGRLGQTLPEAQVLLRVPLTVFGLVADIAVIVFTSLLILLERGRVARWFLQFFGEEDRERLADLFSIAFSQLGAYVRGQLILMFLIGAGTALGMVIFGVPFALAMGVLGFLLEAVPNFGPILAGIPVVLLGLLQSPLTALLLLAWLLGLQALESYILNPYVQHRMLAISPLVVFLAVITGFTLLGVVGGLIAVPVVAVIDVVLREVIIPFRHRELREQGQGVLASSEEEGGPEGSQA